MKSKDEILADVRAIFTGKWSSRDGRVVPDTEALGLGNDAMKLEGTVLYADMADSTGLVNGYRDFFAAEVYKAYLVAACHVIRNFGGEITAFDGDRVMGVFLGNQKNTSAAKAGLQINYVVREVNALLKQQYPNSTFVLRQAVGIDTSALFVARTGIRNSNDLVWVGRAANYAAKLCAEGDDTTPTVITEDVYNALADEAKFGGNPRRPMWEKAMWLDRGIVVYRSSWWWES